MVPHLVVLVLLLLVAAGLALVCGAFTSELSGETDEAAHYVTALMVHDYSVRGLSHGPMTYAANFYLHYPKVALGHWPPLFYAVQAAWMIPFGDSVTAGIALMCVLSALLAWLVYRVALAEFRSVVAAAGCGALVLLLPPVQMYGRMIMADLPVGLLVLAAALAWTRYLQTEQRRFAIAFAVLSSAAILSKGNGYALAFLPGFSVLLCRRWRIVLNPNTWLAAAIVAFCTLPWNLITRDLIVPTMQGTFSAGFFFTAGRFYLAKLLSGPGYGIAAVALIGVVVKVFVPLFQRRVEPLWGVLFALLLSEQLFHMLVPAGLEIRYLIPSYAALILFMAAGVDWIARSVPASARHRRRIAPALSAIIALAFFVQTFSIPRKRAFGFNEVGQFLSSPSEQAGARRIVCSSSADGEGLLISEIARLDGNRRPDRIVARGTQMFARMDWNGLGYDPLVKTEQDVREVLDAIPADVVVFDASTSRTKFPHERLLYSVLQSRDWRQVGVYPHIRNASTVQEVSLEVYRYAGPPRTAPARLHVELSPKPHITVK